VLYGSVATGSTSSKPQSACRDATSRPWGKSIVCTRLFAGRHLYLSRPSYLGQRQAGPHPPVLPSRRLSDRLRRRTSSQQTALDSSPMTLPNASRISGSSSTTFIPRSATPQGVELGPTSSIYASSYSGSICIGLYGLEPKGVFHGATTLRGLVEGLGKNAGL
jgi:hypothetical protein